MIESFVFDIVDSLLGKLASYAYEQASQVYSLYEDLRSIKDTLSIVRGMLLDKEKTKIQYHGFRDWRRQIQNICYDAEDVLEKFELQHKRKQVLKASCSNRMKVRHFFRSSNLLVLDDVWNDDRAKWIELKDLIKVGTRGSKIMVTTRNNSIASMMGNVPSYVLQGLSLKDCLSLFVKWAFKEGEEEKYPNLVEIGKEIVKKCQGVPLAVRTLGSSLFSKFDLNTWVFVRDSELWNLKQQKDDILPALKLSYDQMPSI
jgi:hypothetical protein